jgi:hypothetical protein
MNTMDAECEYLTKCPMFEFFTLEVTKRFYARLYCRGIYEDCERHKLRKTGLTVPDRLLPDGQAMPDDWIKPTPSPSA